MATVQIGKMEKERKKSLNNAQVVTGLIMPRFMDTENTSQSAGVKKNSEINFKMLSLMCQ